MNRDYRDEELRDSVVLPHSVKEAVRKSCLDQTFKSRLLGQPTETLRTEGCDLPPGVAVEVLQDTAEVLHLVLPFKGMSSEVELSDEKLALVVGGSRKTATSKSMYS
jgi:nitrile hydratase alpha subunit